MHLTEEHLWSVRFQTQIAQVFGTYMSFIAVAHLNLSCDGSIVDLPFFNALMGCASVSMKKLKCNLGCMGLWTVYPGVIVDFEELSTTH